MTKSGFKNPIKPTLMYMSVFFILIILNGLTKKLLQFEDTKEYPLKIFTESKDMHIDLSTIDLAALDRALFDLFEISKTPFNSTGNATPLIKVEHNLNALIDRWIGTTPDDVLEKQKSIVVFRISKSYPQKTAPKVEQFLLSYVRIRQAIFEYLRHKNCQTMGESPEIFLAELITLTNSYPAPFSKKDTIMSFMSENADSAQLKSTLQSTFHQFHLPCDI